MLDSADRQDIYNAYANLGSSRMNKEYAHRDLQNYDPLQLTCGTLHL